MAKKLNIIYHCFCQNDWVDIVREQFNFLAGSNMYITMVGVQSDQIKLEKILFNYNIKAKIYRYQSASIFEHKAMILLRELAIQFPNRNTFYFHSKGASDPTIVNGGWRTYMNFYIVSDFQNLHKILESSNKDATGVLYTIDKEKKYKGNNSFVRFFAGNFWLASNQYLCSLPDYEELRRRYLNDRFLAELYIGWNNPNILYIDQQGTMERPQIIDKIINNLYSFSKIRKSI